MNASSAAASGPLTGFSDFAAQAMRWAEAVASARAERAHTTPVTTQPYDVLVGTLLADPGPDSVPGRLLDHFGLSVGDFLPTSHPAITGADLSRHLARTETAESSSEVLEVASGARSLSRGEVRVSHVLGALLMGRAQKTYHWMDQAFGACGTSVQAVRDVYLEWLRDDKSRQGKDADEADGLAAWLKSRLPREPVFVADYASDRIDEQNDLVGIRAEADAFAYLIASRDLKPPLAIGLFGDWGSGKSFLMRSVQHRIQRLGSLVTGTGQADADVWEHIAQIEFNAWEYVHGNLWAGLLERIFRELGSLSPLPLVASRREPVLKEMEQQALRIKTATADIEQSEGELKTAEARREEALGKVKAAQNEVEQKRSRAAEELLKQRSGELRKVVEERLLGSTAADLLTALRDIRGELLRGRALLGAFWSPWRIVLVTLGSVLIPLAAFLLTKVHVPTAISVLGGLVTLVPIVTTALRTGTRQTQEWLKQIEQTMAEIDADGQQQVDEARNEVADAEAALETVQARLEVKRAVRDRARQERVALGTRLRELTPARVFVDYAVARSTDYRRRLGLLSTVREDLRRIEEQVLENNHRILKDGAPSARGRGGAGEGNPADRPVPNRIVLYIDDLDRCPPATVVEVLEAVHLLLAFEMFVVVVAVDSRWLDSALTGRLSALRPASAANGVQPTTYEYLEKIFQVPFWVQPLSDSGRAQLIRGLLAPASIADHEERHGGPPQTRLQIGPGQAEVLKSMARREGSGLQIDTTPLALTHNDLEFIERLAPLLGSTPRRIKRFVNISRLLLAVPPRLNETTQPSERSAVCFLAAVNQGLPSVAKHLFEAIDRGVAIPLGNALTDWITADEHERDLLENWLRNNAQWRDMPINRLGVRHTLVRRLGFDAPKVHHEQP
ncbi:P-loop NTPase fold protein [Streptomyces sp. NPDC060065]|uniref:P-loop NTPase fold protein n=1 Tax=Streptomyces sp. NPDC060065 TaxID=3347050 RepID=UPI0036D169D5